MFITSCVIQKGEEPVYDYPFDNNELPTVDEFNEMHRDYSKEEYEEALLDTVSFFGDEEELVPTLREDVTLVDLDPRLAEEELQSLMEVMEKEAVYSQAETLAQMEEEAEELPKTSKMVYVKKEELHEPSLSDNALLLTPQPVIKEKGLMVHNIPNEMKVGESTRVELRITRNAYFSEFEIGLKDANKTTTIRTSSKMHVKLYDGSADTNNPFFIVNSVNKKALQLVANGKSTTYWQWDVLPVRSGKSKLNLIIHIVSDEGETWIPVHEDDIEIESNLSWSVKRFFTDHWEFFAGGVIIPVLGYLVKRYIPFLRRREEED